MNGWGRSRRRLFGRGLEKEEEALGAKKKNRDGLRGRGEGRGEGHKQVTETRMPLHGASCSLLAQQAGEPGLRNLNVVRVFKAPPAARRPGPPSAYLPILD